jgi:hypothetical protein
MRGSIRKRGGTYTYILDLPPDPVTGDVDPVAVDGSGRWGL